MYFAHFVGVGELNLFVSCRKFHPVMDFFISTKGEFYKLLIIMINMIFVYPDFQLIK